MNDVSDLLPATTHLGRSVLTVEDEGAMLAFYRDVVGLVVLLRDDSRTVLGTGETPLLELRGDEPEGARPPAAAGLFHNAFEVGSRKALGDTLARIQDHWELTGASDHGVSEALYCTDPEGNGV